MAATMTLNIESMEELFNVVELIMDKHEKQLWELLQDQNDLRVRLMEIKSRCFGNEPAQITGDPLLGESDEEELDNGQINPITERRSEVQDDVNNINNDLNIWDPTIKVKSEHITTVHSSSQYNLLGTESNLNESYQKIKSQRPNDWWNNERPNTFEDDDGDDYNNDNDYGNDNEYNGDDKIEEESQKVVQLFRRPRAAQVSNKKKAKVKGGANNNKGNRLFECQSCHIVLKSLAHLKSHIVMHDLRKSNSADKITHFPCTECDKTFTYQGHLVIHMRKHTGERPYVCPICKMGFVQLCNMKTHAKTHTGERPYVCKICNKGFIQKNNMLVHMKKH